MLLLQLALSFACDVCTSCSLQHAHLLILLSPSADFVSGIATCALGHSNPELTEAVSTQMTKLHHVSNLYYTPQQAKLAAWLCENSCADKAFFCNSGAESNEAAIKLARRHANNRGITVSYLFLEKLSS